MVPTFVPFPSESFATRFYVICACNLRVRVPRHLNDTGKPIPRRITLKGATRHWNRFVKKRLAVYDNIKTRYVTCSICGKGDLTWGKRHYKSPWKSSADYVLYERMETGATTFNIRGQAIKASKLVAHKCATNIKSITYSDS
jgi:hypothetical protein